MELAEPIEIDGEMLPALSAAGQRYFAAIPPTVPGEFDATIHVGPRAVGRWKVTHACEDIEHILPLAEAQFEIGMRPALLTPNGWFDPAVPVAPAPPLSLVHAWREVRHWRNVFARDGVGQSGEILHAHCFSAGMAGLRAALPVVYDVAAPLGSATPNAGAWLVRSLRVAESFVLSRAVAVVVHNQQTWNWALELGARAEDLFLIPDPVILPAVLVDNTAWLISVASTRPAVTFFSASMNGEVERLIRAFALVADEIDGAHLLVESDAADRVRAEAAKLNVGNRVHPIAMDGRDRALTCCDVVISTSASLAIEAFSYGRALLAADTPDIREVTPNGRGCVWFRGDSERDLAFRASFLARNPDFRTALGGNGRAHVQATRGVEVVARRYDDVYRHALKRHRAGTRPDIFHGVPILACC